MNRHDGTGPDVNPATGDEAETEPNPEDPMSRDRIVRSRRRVTVDISSELIDWVDAQATSGAHGREIVVERALADYRRVVERDRANPRP